MLNFEVPDMYVKVYENQFNDRQKTLFQALESAEKDCGKDVEVKTLKAKRKHDSSSWRSEVKSFRGQESIFKVPDEPPPRMRFKNIVSEARNAANRSPKRGRWTKYSLETVDDMSDSSNARAAFSFLQELESRKQGSPENRSENVSLDHFKPVFHKRETPNRHDNKTNFQSTRKISDTSSNTPAQQKRESNSSTIVSKETKRPVITLHHLDESEE